MHSVFFGKTGVTKFLVETGEKLGQLSAALVH
jgi:hypothetical protein